MVQIPSGEGLDKERSREWCRQVRKRRVQCSGEEGSWGLNHLNERVWEGKWLVLGLYLLFSQLQTP